MSNINRYGPDLRWDKTKNEQPREDIKPRGMLKGSPFSSKIKALAAIKARREEDSNTVFVVRDQGYGITVHEFADDSFWGMEYSDIDEAGLKLGDIVVDQEGRTARVTDRKPVFNKPAGKPYLLGYSENAFDAAKDDDGNIMTNRKVVQSEGSKLHHTSTIVGGAFDVDKANFTGVRLRKGK